MKLRTLLDFILRPIPAGETPEAVRSRRTGDYVVAAVFGVVVLAGLFWGLRTQMTTPLGDFVGRAPPTTDEPQREAVDVELTFTPGEEAAAKGVEPPVPQVAAPVVEGFADPGENLSAKIQDEVRAYGETVRTRMDADLRTQADALVKSLPPPTFVELPPRSASADTPPVPAPPAPK